MSDTPTTHDGAEQAAATPDAPADPGVFAHLDVAALTDVGRKRKNNEDAFVVIHGHGVYCVADGMGGAEDGEVASNRTVEQLRETFAEFPEARPPSLEAKAAWTRHAVDAASSWICNRSAERGKSGTGTTFVCAVLDPANPGNALALHAGDSRLYVLAKGRLRQVTRDHSFANEAGVKDEKSLNPEFRNVILRAVGLTRRVELEATPFQLEAGGMLLVCSDGLTRMVNDDDIEKMMRDAKSADDAAKALVSEALRAGGKDNVTVVVARAAALPPPVPADALETRMPPEPEPLREAADTASSEGMETTPVTRPEADEPMTGGELAQRLLRSPWVLIAAGVLALVIALAALFSPKKAEPPQPAPEPAAAKKEESAEEAEMRRMANEAAGRNRAATVALREALNKLGDLAKGTTLDDYAFYWFDKPGHAEYAARKARFTALPPQGAEWENAGLALAASLVSGIDPDRLAQAGPDSALARVHALGAALPKTARGMTTADATRVRQLLEAVASLDARPGGGGEP